MIAFAKAAVVAQDVTNCLTKIFIKEALDQAQELDKHLEVSGNVVGPLHSQLSLILLFMFGTMYMQVYRFLSKTMSKSRDWTRPLDILVRA